MSSSVFLPVVGLFAGDDQPTQPAVGEKVFFVHEPNNPYDPAAIRVDSEARVKLGYIARTATHYIHEAVANGLLPTGTIDSVAYGRGGKGKPKNLTVLVTYA